MALTPLPSPQALAAEAVHRYLHSGRGRLTPTRVRARLLLLDWESVGAYSVPTDDQVHWTRLWLEETGLEVLREELARVRAERGFCPAEALRAASWAPSWASR